VVLTLVAVVVCGPALYFWYNYQHGRHAAAILIRARAMYDDKDWRAASTAFHQYLRLRPNDSEALILRAQSFDKQAVEPVAKLQAASHYLYAIRANPDRVDLRPRRAEILYELGRYHPPSYVDALEEIERVQEVVRSQPEDQTTPSGPRQVDRLAVDRLHAAAYRENIGLARRCTVDKAVGVFEDALQAHPGDIELSVGLANLLDKYAKDLADDTPDEARSHAERVIDEMVRQHAGDRDGLLARFRYQNAFANPSRPDQLLGNRRDTRDHDLADLIKAAPDDVEVLIEAAGAFNQKAAAEFQRALAERDATAAAELRSSAEEHTASAQRCEKRLLEVAPDERRVYFTVAALLTNRNQIPEAIETLKSGLQQFGDDDMDLNFRLLSLVLRIGDAEAARATVARIKPVFRNLSKAAAGGGSRLGLLRTRTAEDIEMAEVQIQLLEGNTTAAIPQLKRLAAGVTEFGDPENTNRERRRRWRLLAEAYSRVGLHDLAAAAFDTVIRLKPRVGETYLRAGVEWRMAGDLDRAIKWFEVAKGLKPEVPGAWQALAEAYLDQQLNNLDAEKRDWREFDAAIKQVRARTGGSAPVLLMEARAAIARNYRPIALNRLQELVADPNLDVGLLPPIAALWQAVGNTAEADAALQRYRESVDDPVQWALVESNVLARRGEAPAGIAVLEQALERAPAAARNAIVRRLVELEIDSGSIQSARRRLQELRDAKSAELWVYEFVADLAIVAGDFAELDACERELEVVEGPAGVMWRFCRAVRLLENASDTRAGQLEAAQLLNEIDAARPNWPLSLVLQGLLQERSARDEEDKTLQEKKLDQAIEHYEHALRSGVRTLTAQQRLVGTLYRLKRGAAASSYVRQWGLLATLSGEFSPLAVTANLQAGRLEDALRMSRAAAELRPGDAISQLWYAQCLALSNNSSDAEALFRKATRLAPTEIRAWTGLVWFYNRERRLADARQALNDLLAHVDLNPFNREVAWARGLELIGDRKGAEQHYLQARQENSKDPKLLEELGRFFLPFDQEKAFRYFQEALKVDPKSTAARRQIALICGLRGNDAELAQALALLGPGDEAGADDDRRMQAALLLRRGGDENCRQAVQLLSSLIKSAKSPVAGDRLLLAKAYTDLADIDAAQNQYETLLQTQDEPLFQLQFVRFLNQFDRLDLADQWLSRLEQDGSGKPEILDLRVDWLQRSQRIAEIVPLVDGYVERQLKILKDDSQELALLRNAAELFTELKLYDAAEKKYREIMRRYPGSYKLLALWLAKRGRFEEALAVCLEKTSGPDLTAAATSLVEVLTLAIASPSGANIDSAPAEEAIAAVNNAQTVNPSFLLVLGVLRAMQGRNAEAISLYERILAQEPGNAIVMNNLAVVLAETTDRKDEALRYMEKALAAYPESLEVLDTKGLVLAGIGRFDEAREIFERLCKVGTGNPRYHLHLALTLKHLGHPSLAREHAKIAIDNNVDSELLTPPERQFVSEAKSELSPSVQ
jgi:tetratricopeptide (TPR) repeat protein